MDVKRVIVSMSLAAAVVVAVEADAVTVTVDKVQQRYPYNGLVDIDYTLSYGEGEALDPFSDVRIEAVAINRAVTPATTNRIRTLMAPAVFSICPGRHRVTWNANADGVNCVSLDFLVRIKICHYPEKFMIVDVSNPTAETFPVKYVTGRSAASFNTEEFKGDKIVFRLINPCQFYMGSPDSEPGRYDYKSKNQPDREIKRLIQITKPFYIGLFEMTQKQYENVCGETPSVHAGDYRPVDNVPYSTLRGPDKGAQWPANDEVDEDSFFGVLRRKTGLRFDLPTEAQWECACRAETETPFSDGVPCTTVSDFNTQMNVLGRYSGNADNTFHTTVGTYAPNHYGLYDMHGNVYELCLDWWNLDKWAETRDTDTVDPKGPATGTYRIIRGGAWRDDATAARSASRNFDAVAIGSKPQDYSGFRAALTLQ